MLFRLRSAWSKSTLNFRNISQPTAGLAISFAPIKITKHTQASRIYRPTAIFFKPASNSHRLELKLSSLVATGCLILFNRLRLCLFTQDLETSIH